MAFVSSYVLLILLNSALHFQCSSSSSGNAFVLSVENPESIIKSINQVFTAGFYNVGENAFAFAIWFTEPHGKNLTVIWMANREVPVNGHGSTLTLRDTGNLVLNDAGHSVVWATNTTSKTTPKLVLNDYGNLILSESNDEPLWQSFEYPTDTLVPDQPLTRYTKLVSSRSQTNFSSGFYKLFFDNDNVLRLLYDGPVVSSIYWPDPGLVSWEAGRSTYNASRIAILNPYGNFSSSDNITFKTSDYGPVIQRRLTVGCDGNLRVYGRKNWGEEWSVSWQAQTEPCKIHGICGDNSVCINDPYSGRKCSCLPGYEVKNVSDWSFGCKQKFNLSCNSTESRFLNIKNVEFYGYDRGYFPNYTYKQCEDACLELCNCKGFQYKPRDEGYYGCYPKTRLLNGHVSSNFAGSIYLRLPKSSSFTLEEPSVKRCNHVSSIMLERLYVLRPESLLVKVLFWLVLAIGSFEAVGIFLVWCLVRTKRKSGTDQHGYHLTATGFRSYSYSELKEATKGFSEEIGRGAGGIVYKGVLKDQRAAAIKRLNEASQRESEFLAEVNIIGRLNHMNLIDMWGYCAEGKHRLLVYEYMENRSLAENLVSNNSSSLDWRKRFNIALGTARGLAYLHEECLEWILHCDIKPQNILLDSDYQPKVADFGLSKLLNRNDSNNSGFSTIRGTRGYMAPEWVFNLRITSKVDVYSYGIVVLEIITGKSLTGSHMENGTESQHHGRLVTWVREKKNGGDETTSWVEQIIDPTIAGNYEIEKMEILARLALDCVEEERDARPTMSQVVEMLQDHETGSHQ